jgi:hypothetical protein
MTGWLAAPIAFAWLGFLGCGRKGAFWGTVIAVVFLVVERWQ